MSSEKDTRGFLHDVGEQRQQRPGTGATAAVLVPGGLLALLSTTIVGVAVPDVIVDLGIDIAAAQWVTIGYLLAAGIGIAMSGWASRRFGIRATWQLAILLFVLGALASAIAPDVTTLTLARVLQGLGGGALEPIMLTVLARAAGPRKIGRAMGAVAAVMAIGPLAGPALGGLGVDTVGWRWMFALTAALGVLVAVASWFVLRPERAQPSRLDLPGLLLVAVGTVLSLFGLSRAATPAGFDTLAMSAIGTAVLAFAAFIWWGLRHGDGAIINLATFRSSGFAPAVFIMAMMGAAVYPLFFGLPQFYQGVAGMNALAAGLLMIPYGLGNFIAMPLAGRLSDHIDGRRLIWIGSAVTLVGFLLLIATGPTTPLIAFAAISLLIGLGLGSIGSPTVSSIYRELPPELVPSGSSTLFIVNQLGGSLGVAILTILIGGSSWTAAVGTSPFWVPVAATVAIAIVASWVTLPRG